MPELLDPETALPTKRKATPSQIIMWLLYPVIFAIGLSVGLVIGIQQGKQQANENQNAVNQVPTTVIPNANNRVNTNTSNANVNVAILNGGDFLKLDAATQAELNQQEQADKENLIDQSVSLTDVVRQRDLITLKYDLLAYFAVNESYPSTSNVQIRLDRKSGDTLYQALKDFYGGSYNEPIDPEDPTYYYGYTSDGTSFELTTILVSKNKQVFRLTED